MIDEFFKIEGSAINDELEKFFDGLNKSEKEILFSDFNNHLREFVVPKITPAKRLHPIFRRTNRRDSESGNIS